MPFVAMELDEQFGATLRKLREERGWSLSYVGEICGTSAANISKIERGRAKEYSLLSLLKLGEAYGLRLHQLFALIESVDLGAAALGDDESALLDAYRSLSTTQRETLMSVAITLRPAKAKTSK